ncbi:MAG: hypothetical protein IT381_27345 [Deltaproteobacteria bacterium]|nr:hypothetical protein [Deltaproteobacteria bacterium]
MKVILAIGLLGVAACGWEPLEWKDTVRVGERFELVTLQDLFGRGLAVPSGYSLTCDPALLACGPPRIGHRGPTMIELEVFHACDALAVGRTKCRVAASGGSFEREVEIVSDGER